MCEVRSIIEMLWGLEESGEVWRFVPQARVKRFAREERVRVAVVVEAVRCPWSLRWAWSWPFGSTASLRPTKPLGAQGGMQVLRTGAGPSRWWRSVRCGCGWRVRDLGETDLQSGREQDVEWVGNLAHEYAMRAARLWPVAVFFPAKQALTRAGLPQVCRWTVGRRAFRS